MKSLNSPYSSVNTREITALLGKHALPLGTSDDLDPLMEMIGDAKYVLLGEASHGTHEYYTWRMKLTQRLLLEKNFSFISVEGDWPDCYRVNRYVKNLPGAGESAEQVLREFNRWPTWMWGNWEMVAFAEWLKEFNRNRSVDKRVGFYGLDVYSLSESMSAIVKYLEQHDKEALKIAIRAAKCFEPFGSDEGQSYARASTIVPELCEREVIDMLLEIKRKMPNYNSDPENVFSIEQNAHIAVDAERYYRAMIRGGADSWNIRDRHMVSTLERLMKFHGSNAKTVVWEHNTHIGNARATDMAYEGMVNVGELISDKYAKEGVVAIGFGSYQGSVIAGREWGDVMRKIKVPEAIRGSWEQMFHTSSGGGDRLLLLNKLKEVGPLAVPVGHRAIGVVYNPEYEQYGNYVPSILPQRYDAFIFIDKSKALYPLQIQPDGEQVPETYPFGV